MPTILFELAVIQNLHPRQGTVSMVAAFLRMEVLLAEMMQTADDTRPYIATWTMLTRYGRPELQALMFYSKYKQTDPMALAKYAEVFRRLQFSIVQAVKMLP
ncbi:hypothetical protein [Spirosoma koreense]